MSTSPQPKITFIGTQAINATAPMQESVAEGSSDEAILGTFPWIMYYWEQDIIITPEYNAIFFGMNF